MSDLDRHLDPDATLNDIRSAISDYTVFPVGTVGEAEALKRVLELTDDLDTYLTAGGVLPREWRPSLPPTLTAMAERGEVTIVTPEPADRLSYDIPDVIPEPWPKETPDP